MKYLIEDNDNIYAKKLHLLEDFLYKNNIIISSKSDLIFYIDDKEFRLNWNCSEIPRVVESDRFEIIE